MVQVISQQKSVSLSYTDKLAYQSHLNSSSAGLVYMLHNGRANLTSYIASVEGYTTAQVLAVPFSPKDPMPGGCCITCAFDNDPNIYTKKESLKVQLDFGRGNVFFDPGELPDVCDGDGFKTFNQLVYDLYFYQLRENDLTEEGLFNAVWRMSSPVNIKKYGKMVTTIEKAQRTNFVLQSIAYHGVVYNILIRDIQMKTEACYMPTFAYGCDITDKSTCKSFGSVTTIVFVSLSGLIGLILCFSGHKFVIAAHMLASSAAGFAFGVFIVALYMETSLFRAVFLNNSLLVGFLVACSVLFSPVGDLKPFSSNTVFLLTFVSIMLACPIPQIFFPKVISILFSSLIGGYVVVVACSVFLHANIQYIVVEFVLRAGIPSFADAYLRVPFDTNEYILCGVWGFLLISGAACQVYITRNDPFPPPWKRSRRSNGRFSSFLRRRGRTNGRLFDERTPLLQNESVEQTYGTETKMTPRRQSPSVNVVL
eukprot:gene11347-21538_t